MLQRIYINYLCLFGILIVLLFNIYKTRADFKATSQVSSGQPTYGNLVSAGIFKEDGLLMRKDQKNLKIKSCCVKNPNRSIMILQNIKHKQ